MRKEMGREKKQEIEWERGKTTKTTKKTKKTKKKNTLILSSKRHPPNSTNSARSRQEAKDRNYEWAHHTDAVYPYVCFNRNAILKSTNHKKEGNSYLCQYKPHQHHHHHYY
jgi:hypothetical protein